MNLRKITLNIGLKEPVRLLHISDTHICLADERDDQRKRDLARSRGTFFHTDGAKRNNADPAFFPFPEDHLREQVAYARENGLLLIHTGDVIDFVSEQNLETAAEILSGTDYFLAPGNHEFSLYVGEAWEDVPYKMQSFDHVQELLKIPLHFAVRQIGGLKLIAMDNTYYLFDEKQLELLKKELEDGLPVILLLHTPLYTAEIFGKFLAMTNGVCAYLCGCPEECYAHFSSAERIRQQRADAPTKAMIDLIRSSSQIKGIFTGHKHIFHRHEFAPGVPQILGGASYAGDAIQYEIY